MSAAAPEVVVYATSICPYCHAARRLLDDIEQAYTLIDVGRDFGLRRQMVERSGRSSVPQIFIGERHVGGYDDLALADRDGLLDGWLRGDAG